MFGLAIAAMVASVAMIACSKDDAPAPQEESEFYTVQLGWGGEIVDIAYEPLDTRAATDDLYGIQVYSTPDVELEEGEEVTWKRFAYGLFDDPNNITITLPKGYKYKFEATMVVDGKNRIYNDVNYGYPFVVFDNYSSITTLTNQFNYSINLGFSQLASGYTTMVNGDYNNHPNVERFYGELEDYIPSTSKTSVIIPMKRVSFGAKFVATGTLATSGTLEIELESAPILELELTEGDDSISDIFTFEYVNEAWLNDDYTETIGVSFKWIREDGSMVPLGTHSVKYTRNMTTVVTVTINKDGETEGVGFEIDDSEKGPMPENEDNSVTIVDGEVETGE